MKPKREPDTQPQGRSFQSLNDEELADLWVSGSCKFNDDEWYFENPTPGAKNPEAQSTGGCVSWMGVA